MYVYYLSLSLHPVLVVVLHCAVLVFLSSRYLSVLVQLCLCGTARVAVLLPLLGI